MFELGAVAIGRNEGERLKACLATLRRHLHQIVYVDSGSSDGSLAYARDLGVDVVELDDSEPFTAARARNAGFRRLTEGNPNLEYVHFIDSDCELVDGWLPVAYEFICAHSSAAVVCGRRRERHPEKSIYNRLCDMEWDTPIGEVAACGGDALMRVSAFREVNGFAGHLIAGEEPDLCHRLKARGWKVYRLPHDMTLHDAAILRVEQWWLRAKRSGYADAEASHRRGTHDRLLKRKVWSNSFWGFPLIWPLWPVLWIHVCRSRGALYATHIVAGKLPHLVGQLTYWRRNVGKAPANIIEYK